MNTILATVIADADAGYCVWLDKDLIPVIVPRGYRLTIEVFPDGRTLVDVDEPAKDAHVSQREDHNA